MSPNKILKCLAAGALGAVALTALHRVLRRPPLSRAPGNLPPRTPEGPRLYSLVRAASFGKTVATGAALGLAAGIGSVFTAGPASPGARHANRDWSASAMSAGLSAAGGLAAGLAYRRMNTK